MVVGDWEGSRGDLATLRRVSERHRLAKNNAQVPQKWKAFRSKIELICSLYMEREQANGLWSLGCQPAPTSYTPGCTFSPTFPSCSLSQEELELCLAILDFRVQNGRLAFSHPFSHPARHWGA